MYHDFVIFFSDSSGCCIVIGALTVVLVLLDIVLTLLLITICMQIEAATEKTGIYNPTTLGCIIANMIVGVISMLLIIKLQINNFCNEQYNITSMSKLRLIFFSTFGIGYITHCVLYLFMHFHSVCPLRREGIMVNFFILTFIFLNIFSAYVQGYYSVGILENNADISDVKIASLWKWFSIAIVVGACLVDVTVWFDSYISEWINIYNFPIEVNTENSTNETTPLYKNCTDDNQVTDFIEKTEPLLNPMIIEFSLMAIQITIKTLSNNNDISNTDITDSYHDIPTQDDERDNTANRSWWSKCCQVVFEILVPFFTLALGLVLVVFSYFVTLTGENSHEQGIPTTFLIYHAIQIVLKSAMIILIILLSSILYHSRKSYLPDQLRFCSQGKCCFVLRLILIAFTSGFVVVLLAALSNISYIIINIDALSYGEDFKSFVTVAKVDSIISIFLAIMHMILIGVWHVLERYTKNKNVQFKNVLCNFCLMLSFFNFGLWLSDCIGENRKPIFTEIQYRNLGENIWRVNTKLLLPGTIFFRFHCAMFFLEMRYHLSEKK